MPSHLRPAAAEVEQALSVPPDPSAAAFFDVDNTIMVGASIFHFAKGLASRKFFTWRDLGRFAFRQLRLRLRGESHGDMHTNALAELHLDAGQRVWLVTATPVELAQIIADRLGLTGALGTVAETQDGVYTGRLVGEVLHGEAKAAAVQAIAAREGLDLSRCAAYSDSINDLPMLSLVGRPVAVNPDSALRGEARQRGWELRDFRTGRKAARIGVPTALGVGAVAGGIAAGLAMRRRQVGPFSARPSGAARAIGRACSGSFRGRGR